MPQKIRKNHSSLSVSEFAKGLGYSRSEVIKSLAQLEELKLIERDRTSHKHGGKWKVTGLGKITAAMLDALPKTAQPAKASYGLHAGHSEIDSRSGETFCGGAPILLGVPLLFILRCYSYRRG